MSSGAKRRKTQRRFDPEKEKDKENEKDP